MLEEVGRENGGRGSGQVQGRGQQEERELKRQRLPAGMEACTEKQEVQDTKVERRLLGKNLRFVQRVQLAATGKQAAAKNEGYERYDEEIQIKRKSGR